MSWVLNSVRADADDYIGHGTYEDDDDVGGGFPQDSDGNYIVNARLTEVSDPVNPGDAVTMRALASETSTLRGDIELNNSAIAGISTAASANTTSINALSATVSGHTTTLSSQAGLLATHTSAIGTLDTKVGTLETTVAGHTTGLASAQSGINSLAASVSDHGTRISALEDVDDDYDTRLDALETTTSGHTTSISGLTTTTSGLTTTTNTLKTTVNAHGSAISALQTTTSTNAGNISTNSGDISTLDGRVDTLDNNTHRIFADAGDAAVTCASDTVHVHGDRIILPSLSASIGDRAVRFKSFEMTNGVTTDDITVSDTWHSFYFYVDRKPVTEDLHPRAEHILSVNTSLLDGLGSYRSAWDEARRDYVNCRWITETVGAEHRTVIIFDFNDGAWDLYSKKTIRVFVWYY